MPFISFKASAAVLALGALAFAGQAYAFSPLPLKDPGSIAVKVGEGTAVEQEERPNQVPPGSQEQSGAAVKDQPADQGENSGANSAGEIPALQQAFPQTDWPPADRGQ
jgi:hypothetical protein